MSHWNSILKPGQTVVVVICETKDVEDAEQRPAVYAIRLHDGSDSDQDEIVAGESDDYTYIDVEQCAQA